MDNILRAVAIVTVAIIDVLEILMFIRAIMSWFIDHSNKFYGFLISITEPVISPVRKLLSKTSFARGTPIDLSFLVTYLLLEIVRMVLNLYF